MKRTSAVLALGALALLGACSATSTSTTPASVATDANQAAYAAEEAYSVAAHAEVTAWPLLTAADKVTVKALDAKVYADVKALRSAAAVGSDVAALVTVFQADLGSLNALVGKK